MFFSLLEFALVFHNIIIESVKNNILLFLFINSVNADIILLLLAFLYAPSAT